MSINLTVNGVIYAYPETDDQNWGPDATDWASAVTTGMLQKSGGLFQLLAEADFGTAFGIKSLYYKSRTSNPASAGQIRLARADAISWRNEANNGNLDLTVDSSDRLVYNGIVIQNTLSVSDTSTIDLTLAADVLSASIVSNSITNSMVNSAAAIAYSKLALSGSIVNADVNASAAIAYSKLSLTGSIVNADINASAAIAYSKLAALTASRALVSDGSGFVSASSVTSTELGYVSGVTSAIQTQLGTKLPLAGGTMSGAIAMGTNAITGMANPSSAQDAATKAYVDAQVTSGSARFSPVIQRYTSGSGTHNKSYTFTISTGSATAGATYTNNGITYTVYATVSSALIVVMTGNGAPTSSGTLTKASGTGDATLTFTAVAAPLYFRIQAVGGGGGGGPSGTSGSTAATAGGTTTFGSLISAPGGSPGAFGGAAGAGGGYPTITAPAIDMGSVAGGYGGGASWSANSTATASLAGGTGGASFFGGGSAQSYAPAGAAPGASAWGAGGAGAGNGTSAAQNYVGSGGGAGGYASVIVSSPSATYSYAVGAGGSKGFTNANGFDGGAGGSGLIIVTEYYQ